MASAQGVTASPVGAANNAAIAPASVASGAPFGQTDAVTTAVGTVTAGGWAIDPDTAGPIIVQMYVDGSANALTWANQSRPDIGAAFPAAGPNHGYTLTMPATAGAHTVCLFAINTGPGTSTSLGCRAISVPSSDPFGHTDAVATAAGTVTASGWAIDPDTAGPILVQMYVDGSAHSLTWANQPRPDIGAAFPAAGPNHGYTLTMPATAGAHTVCLYAINTGPGTSVSLGCRAITVPSTDPFGHTDVVTTAAGTVTASGWAIDPDAAGPIIVQMYVDGSAYALTRANQARPDIGAAFPSAGPNHGFTVTMPATAGAHTVCLFAINTGPGTSTSLGCRAITVPNSDPFGHTDTAVTGPSRLTATGWAIDPDTAGPIIVQMYVDGSAYALTWANQPRPDIGAAFPSAGPNHGFTVTMPATAGAHTVCLFAINTGPGTSTSLGCRAVTVAVLGSMAILPGVVRVAAGESQTFTASGYDSQFSPLGDVTSTTIFDVDGDRSACTGSTCSFSVTGEHHVTGTDAIHGIVSSFASVLSYGSWVYAGGYNAYGQLGDGTTVTRSYPVRVGDDAQWESVAAGHYHSAAVKTDGSLWTWGRNNSGQLGDATLTDRSAPVEVASDVPWALVAAGGDQTLAVKADGTLWAWGSNVFGQLGDGSLTNRSAPAQVGTDTQWESVATGGNDAAALKTDGTLWTWGWNLYGQLGDGSLTNSPAPAQVGTDTDWESVTVGWGQTVAVKTDGTLWAWGANGSGQLGDGTGVNRSVPVQVGTDTDWESASAGGSHTVAVKTDGTLWAWGYNADGQLGIGNTFSRLAPTQVGADSDWAYVVAGEYHTMAVKTDGDLWGWGHNRSGELTDGTTQNRWEPEKIGVAVYPSVAAGGFHTVVIDQS